MEGALSTALSFRLPQPPPEGSFDEHGLKFEIWHLAASSPDLPRCLPLITEIISISDSFKPSS